MKWKNKIAGSLVILAVFAVCLAVGYFTSRPVENLKEEEIFAEEAGSAAELEQKITVYVNGEVNRPGVYSLVAGSRIKDAIEASGGFTAAADIKRVNLAKKVRDEDYIFIDTQGQPAGGGRSFKLRDKQRRPCEHKHCDQGGAHDSAGHRRGYGAEDNRLQGEERRFPEGRGPHQGGQDRREDPCQVQGQDRGKMKGQGND